MLIKAPAKINLKLFVGEKLTSGLHQVETTFAEIPLYDKLDFTVTNDGKFTIIDSQKVTNRVEDNLIYRAANLLKENYQIGTAGFICRLQKNIPLGAGLGGGSSDAAATLKALNQLWQLNLRDRDLFQLAKKLGADVPFFMVGGVQHEPHHGTNQKKGLFFVNGPVLPPAKLLVVKPDFSINTASAYAELDRHRATTTGTKNNPITPLKNQPSPSPTSNDLADLVAQLHNDFTEPTFNRFPIYQQLSTLLFQNQALNVTLAGSGSAVFSFFNPQKNLNSITQNITQKFPDYQTFALEI